MYIRMYVTLSINSNRNRVKAEKKEERKKTFISVMEREGTRWNGRKATRERLDGVKTVLALEARLILRRFGKFSHPRE